MKYKRLRDFTASLISRGVECDLWLFSFYNPKTKQVDDIHWRFIGYTKRDIMRKGRELCLEYINAK